MSFGSFQFATVWGASASSLLLIRFLCGVGLGGALPNLIALTAEAGEGRNPILNVVGTVAAMPLGGAIAAYIGFISANNWRLLFYIGGIAPLVLAPLMVVFLKESTLFHQTRSQSSDERERALATLFSSQHWRRTVLLRISFLGTALVLYLLVNWLPQLMIARGFTHSQSFLIQIVFNLAASAGAMALGWIMQRRQHLWLLPACFCGLAIAILLIAGMANNALLVAAIAAVMGMCLVGAQFILYGIAPGYYTTLVRGTGTGAAVAVGRLGAVVGPFFAGQLLARGASAGQVMVSLLPIILIAALAASILTHTPRSQDLQEGANAPV
jgi:AAHS family 3-hydroxyphenylpropionic acid transporter